tara:strand:+ start:149 stop:379 length:231 start_codon:yes stop_codon:yes gene_type:complete
MPMGKWGTVAEAAAHYGITRQRVCRLIAKGSFAGARLVEMPRGRVWLLPFPFKRKTLRNGRPPKAVEKGQHEASGH